MLKRMETFTIIGFVAAVFTTSGFLPQVYKIFRTKSTKDISFAMYMVLAIGTLLWLLYGIMIKELPIIVANSISLSLISAIIVLKVKYK
jgi:MtN3 and saliva related transmembrane protein